jgi:lipopolysaccharide transport system permease protein
MSKKHALELSLSLAKAGFKERNEGSYLGIFWYLLNPLLLFLLLLLVFSDRVGANIPSYPLYLLLGIIMFNFFQKTTIESTKLIRENRWIIKSINFPRGSLISSIVLKNLFSHLFEIILFIIFLLFFKVPLRGIIFYPFILVVFCIFIFGTSLILSALAVYFTDLENIWTFAARLIWLGTPIFYTVGGQTRLAFVSLFNPMYYFITIARDVTVYAKMPQPWMMIGAMGYSLLFLIIGLFIFNRLKTKFAEMV